jgi:hypothetical protein
MDLSKKTDSLEQYLRACESWSKAFGDDLSVECERCNGRVCSHRCQFRGLRSESREQIRVGGNCVKKIASECETIAQDTIAVE